MPTEQIYDQLAKAKSVDEVKSILDGADAKIVYASEAPDAPAAGDAESTREKPGESDPDISGDIQDNGEGEPMSMAESEPMVSEEDLAEDEAEVADAKKKGKLPPLKSLKHFKDKAIDKAMGG